MMCGARRVLEEEPEAEPRSGCPVMRLVRYVLALSAAVCPQPALSALRRRSAARMRAAPAPALKLAAVGMRSSRCPFMRLLLLVGMQVATGAAMHPVAHRGAVRRVSSMRGVSVAARTPPTEANNGRGPGPCSKRVLILGGGWVGSRAANYFAEQGADVTVTYRDLDGVSSKPAYFQPVELSPSIKRTRFELECTESWANLPLPEELADVIVTFPFTDADAALAFHERYLSKAPNVIVCSSTSIYKVEEPNALVTEDTPLRADTARGHAEEGLRKLGVTLLALGGIFGDQGVADGSLNPSQRTVCSCLAMHTAHAPATSAAKLINMVHVDDILTTFSACLRAPQPGMRVNVVGCTIALRDLAAQCGVAEGGRVDASLPADVSSKRICNAKLVKLLPPGHRFRTPLEPPCASEDCLPLPPLHVAQAA